MPASKNSWIELPDINVWLALVFDGHQHHPRAAGWFEDVLPGGAAFCRITQMGLLRLVTNPNVLGESVLSQKRAWAIYDQLRSDERLVFLGENHAVETHWRRLTESDQRAHKLWTDAYVAAFALAHGLRLVTFDRGFKHIKALPLMFLGQ